MAGVFGTFIPDIRLTGYVDPCQFQAGEGRKQDRSASPARRMQHGKQDGEHALDHRLLTIGSR